MHMLAYGTYVYILHAHATCSGHSLAPLVPADNWLMHLKFGNSRAFRGRAGCRHPHVGKRDAVRPWPCRRLQCLQTPAGEAVRRWAVGTEPSAPDPHAHAWLCAGPLAKRRQRRCRQGASARREDTGRPLGYSRAEALRQVAAVFRSRKRMSCCIALWGTHPLVATIPRRHPHAHMPHFFTENRGKAHGITRDPAKTIAISRPGWAPRPPRLLRTSPGQLRPVPCSPPRG